MKELYKKYKSTSLEDIKRHLKQIKIVREKDGKYYPISDKNFTKMLEKPRNVSLTFDATDLQKTPVELTEIKKIEYLVKSSSRFFLKPDIGEVFDQINEMDLIHTTAICVNIEEYSLIDGTDGEHFIMEATLMTDIKQVRKRKLDRINENT